MFENTANQKAFCPISHFEKKICQGLPSIIFYTLLSNWFTGFRHDITRILLKVVLNTINQTLIYCANLWSKVTVSELLRLLVPGSSGSGWSNTVRSKSVPPSNLITTSHKKEWNYMLLKGHNSYNNLQTWLLLFELIRDIIKSVCETKFCGIIDQSLFYINLTVHYIQNFENLT